MCTISTHTDCVLVKSWNLYMCLCQVFLTYKIIFSDLLIHVLWYLSSHAYLYINLHLVHVFVCFFVYLLSWLWLIIRRFYKGQWSVLWGCLSNLRPFFAWKEHCVLMIFSFHYAETKAFFFLSLSSLPTRVVVGRRSTLRANGHWCRHYRRLWRITACDLHFATIGDALHLFQLGDDLGLINTVLVWVGEVQCRLAWPICKRSPNAPASCGWRNLIS